VHDSTLAIWGGTYAKLKEIYERTKAVCCVDSAFSAATVPYLLKSSQDKTMAKDLAHMARLSEATSLRQAAEWGMKAIKGSMPRLRDKFKYEVNGERRIILKLVPLIYNLRLALVGLNQLKSTYVPHWDCDSRVYIRGNV
jgi:hypothetical protein